MAYPYLDLDFQQRTFRTTVSLLRADPLAGIDPRIRDRDLRSTRFAILGAFLQIEIAWIMRLVDVAVFVDDYRARTHERFLDRPVLTTEAWLARTDDLVAIIVVDGSHGFDHFKRMCVSTDRPHLTILEFERLIRTQVSPPRLSQNFNVAYFDETVASAERLERASELLADSFSRVSFYAVLNYRLGRDPAFLAAVAPAGALPARLLEADHPDPVAFGHFAYQLDRRFLRFGSDEVMIDGGAFDGLSAYHMARATDGAFRRIDVYEPDLAFLAQCDRAVELVRAKFGDAAAAKLRLIGKGLWSSTTTLDFLNDFHDGEEFRDLASSMGAHLVDAAPSAENRSMAVRVPVTTIDEMSPDATFIKLEVEGAERAALDGGRATIARNRPKLSVALYHLPIDMYDLPEYVAGLGLGYRLGLRQHNRFSLTATYLYAVAD